MKYNILFLLGIAGLVLFVVNVAALETTCSSCEDCSAKLDGDYDVVRLTVDITDHSGTCIQSNASNVVMDCDDHTISGNGTKYGIENEGFDNVSVKNCVVWNFAHGIYWHARTIEYPEFDHVYRGTFENNQIINSTDDGINLNRVHNVTFSNNTISLNDHRGIYLYGGNHNTITGNYITENLGDYYCGLTMSSSNNNSITGNVVSNNTYCGISFGGEDNTVSSNTVNNNEYGLMIGGGGNTFTENTIQENEEWDVYLISDTGSGCDNTFSGNYGSGNRLIYYYGSPVELSGVEASELILCNASYSNITNVNISGSNSLRNNGVLISSTDYATINDCNSSHNLYGFYLDSSSSNNLIDNEASDNSRDGFRLWSLSDNNTLRQNSAFDNRIGIWLAWDGAGFYMGYGSKDNKFIDNLASGNGAGFYVDSDSNLFENNTATGSFGPGFEVYWCSHNEFIGNDASSNSGSGFTIRGNNNTFMENTARDSELGYGFDFWWSSSYNVLEDNAVCNNDDGDIHFDNTTDSNTGDNICDTLVDEDSNTVTCSQDCEGGAVTTTSTTTTILSECELPGDYDPCGTVELSEVIDFITQWAAGNGELSDVIDLISAWTLGG